MARKAFTSSQGIARTHTQVLGDEIRILRHRWRRRSGDAQIDLTKDVAVDPPRRSRAAEFVVVNGPRAPDDDAPEHDAVVEEVPRLRRGEKAPELYGAIVVRRNDVEEAVFDAIRRNGSLATVLYAHVDAERHAHAELHERRERARERECGHFAV